MYTNHLIETIKVMRTEESYLQPKITHNLVQEYRRLSRNSSRKPRVQRGIKYKKPLHILTKRECQVIQLMAEGNSNRKISETLYISEKTGENHVRKILQKRKIKDRTQAQIEAIRKG